MKKFAIFVLLIGLSCVLISCEKESNTFTTTCSIRVNDEGEYVLEDGTLIEETYVYNTEKVLEVFVNGESVEKGVSVEVGWSNISLHGAIDIFEGFGYVCGDFYWE
jgi:hypothetical protein